MRPLCIFPAHSAHDFYVKCILPILNPQDDEDDDYGISEGSELEKSSYLSKPCGIISVGRGYTDLLSQGEGRSRKGVVAEGKVKDQAGVNMDGYAHHTFLLSWSATQWEYF